MATVQRWVCRSKATNLYATSRSGRYSPNIKFDGELQDAKVYRTRNGAIPYSADPADYEWHRVNLTLVED